MNITPARQHKLNHSGSTIRRARLNKRIKQALILLLAYQVKDARLKAVGITEVALNRDLSVAKVFFTLKKDIAPDQDETQAINEITGLLQKAQGFLRKQLARDIGLRHTPALHFIYDNTPKNAQRIDDLLKKTVV